MLRSKTLERHGPLWKRLLHDPVPEVKRQRESTRDVEGHRQACHQEPKTDR